MTVRSKCKCICHLPGVKAIHVTACCTPDNSWGDNDIQYPRLLAEIAATQLLNITALEESMDLTYEQVMELFDRAQADWEDIKARL